MSRRVSIRNAACGMSQREAVRRDTQLLLHAHTDITALRPTRKSLLKLSASSCRSPKVPKDFRCDEGAHAASRHARCCTPCIHGVPSARTGLSATIFPARMRACGDCASRHTVMHGPSLSRALEYFPSCSSGLHKHLTNVHQAATFRTCHRVGK